LSATAQEERFEVGQRLVRLERTWDQYRQEPAARKRALKALLPVVPRILANQWSEAAQLLDKARHALVSADDSSAEVRWADSLCVIPDTRLQSKKADRLIVSLRAFYKTDLKIPDKARLSLQFLDNGKPLLPVVTSAIGKLPWAINLPASLPEGDHVLQARIEVPGKVLQVEEQIISVVDRPKERVEALKNGLVALGGKAMMTDGQTVDYLARLVDSLEKGALHETNYPAARLLVEAEAALAALQAGKNYYGHGKTGQYRLKLATAEGKFISRLAAPEPAKQGKPLPLVVALHGLGGSENLFFEGYGNGLIGKMCQERGWLLVSPRTNGYLVFTMPVAAIVDEVVRLYPVDRSRIFVVGHSMGAAQAINAAEQTPKVFAAIAPLGGSGKVQDAAKLKSVPFFIGVGSSDFALEGARKLAKQLEAGGVSSVTLKEYPDVEHIMTVREALPDCFALFDKVAKH
jgi:predicted esterase